jgi:4-amino-4-deoxychorismate lyase
MSITKTSICFYKDQFQPTHWVPVPADSLFFRYGAGFFETVLYHDKHIHHLELHLDRLRFSIESFGFQWAEPQIEALILKLLELNTLTHVTARINVHLSIEKWDAPPLLCLQVFPYKPVPEKTYRLQISEQIHCSFLNTHKSTNYWAYAYLKHQAELNGFDDVILTDPNGILLETTSAALFFLINSKLHLTPVAYRLASTTLALLTKEIEFEIVTLTTKDLDAVQHAYVANALIGIKPITSINNLALNPDWEFCNRWNLVLIGWGKF